MLSALLLQGVAFCWTPECARAFSYWKEAPTSSSSLRHFNPDAPVDVHTDASGEGIRAVIAHRDVDGPMEHAIAYVYHKFTKAERDYSATEEECSAIA